MPIPYQPPPAFISIPGLRMNPNDWRARALANEQILIAMHAAAYAGRLNPAHFCFLRERNKYARPNPIRSFT